MCMSTVLKDKGKFRPLFYHEGLEKEYRCSCTVSLTLVLYVLAGDIHTVTGLVSPEMIISFTV